MKEQSTVKEARTRNSFGLFQRREICLPTRRGWMLLIGVLALLTWGGCRSIQPFLAVNAPVSGGALAVEGWLADYALESAVDEFKRGRRDHLYVTGIPLEKGAPLSEYKTYAELGAAVIVKLGLETNVVQAVPAPDVRQDRTYASAVALKKWLQEHGNLPTSLTVISEGAHARRTRLLYEKAFGPGTAIGIIAVPNREYDPARWWASSAGVREVIDESVAYLYARFIFRAPAD